MRKSEKRRTVLRGLTGLIALAVIVVAVVLTVSHFRAKPAPAQREQWVLLEGTLESDEVDVSSKIPGRISRMLVEEGDPVKAGQTVAFLEAKEVNAKVEQATGMYNAATAQQSQAAVAVDLQDRTVRDQVRQAEAGLKAARAKLQMALNGARPQEILQAQKAVEQASAAFNTAQSTYNRFHGLYQEGVIPKQKEEEIQLQYLSAKAQKEAAEAKLSLVKEGARKEEIEQARQGVRAAEAQLKMARDSALQVNLRRQDVLAAGYKAAAAKGQVDEAVAYQDETRVLSPITGYVSERMADQSEMVSAGFPILTLVKSRDFKVKVYADESKFGFLQLHRPVSVVLPALANRELPGRVIRISQAADFATKKATNEQNTFDVRSLEVVVRIQGDHPELRNGMTARVKLPVDGKVR